MTLPFEMARAEPVSAEGVELTPFAAAVLETQPLRGYALRSCLAAGDRHSVFKADDRNMDRTVAVKMMRPWKGREGAVEEFFSLAGSIARLRCQGVARGLDAGRGDGDFFLAYEYLPGESLAGRLARRQSGKYTAKESIRLIGEIARILQRLFELGHPHGHLKPSNVMLADGGRVGLTDIGFAWTMAWPNDGSAFAASPDFLPPERIAGDLNIDIRGDLYALGAIWHLLLLGEPVFRGGTPEETLALHLDGNPVSPRDRDPRLSAATSEMLLWLLEKERDNRPRTPRDFLRKLKTHPLAAEVDDAAAADATDGIETADGGDAHGDDGGGANGDVPKTT